MAKPVQPICDTDCRTKGHRIKLKVITFNNLYSFYSGEEKEKHTDRTKQSFG